MVLLARGKAVAGARLGLVATLGVDIMAGVGVLVVMLEYGKTGGLKIA